MSVDPNELERLRQAQTATRIDPAGARTAVYGQPPTYNPSAAELRGAVQPAPTAMQARLDAGPPRINPGARAALGQVPGMDAGTASRITTPAAQVQSRLGTIAAEGARYNPNALQQLRGIPAGGMDAATAQRLGPLPAAPQASMPTGMPAGAQRPGVIGQAASKLSAVPGAVSDAAQRVAGSTTGQFVRGAGRMLGQTAAVGNVAQGLGGAAGMDPSMSRVEGGLRTALGAAAFIPGVNKIAIPANAALMAADYAGLTQRVRDMVPGGRPAPQPTPNSPQAQQWINQIPGKDAPVQPGAPLAAPAALPAAGRNAAQPMRGQGAQIPAAPQHAGPVTAFANSRANRALAAPRPAAPAAAPARPANDPMAVLPGTPKGYDPIHVISGNDAYVEKYNPATGVYEPQDRVAPVQEVTPEAVFQRAQALAFEGRLDEAKQLMGFLGVQTQTDASMHNAQVGAEAQLGASSISAGAARYNADRGVDVEQLRQQFQPVSVAIDDNGMGGVKRQVQGRYDTSTGRTLLPDGALPAARVVTREQWAAMLKENPMRAQALLRDGRVQVR
jgi:hypothetical protein